MGKCIESYKKIITTNGMTTVRVKMTNNRRVYLHDKDDPQAEAEKWLEKVVLSEHTVYIVYGFGLGYHIGLLLEKLPSSSLVYVIEPDGAENTLEIAKKVIAKPEWIEDKRLKLLSGDLRQVGVEITAGLRQKSINNIFFASFLPVVGLFKDFYERAYVEIPEKLNVLFSSNVDFKNKAGFQYIKNIWQNFSYIVDSDSADCLQNVFQGRPAIVVAAGPSLDKNVTQLAELLDKALIIAAGSAIGALTKHGIAPHFVASIDPFEESAREVYERVMPKTALVSSYETVHELVKNFPNRRFFTANNDSIMPDALKTLMPSQIILARNASVSATAFSFAYAMGANPIIFVGQDLALSPDGNRGHAEGIETVSYDSQTRLEVKGRHGEKLAAVPMFKEMLDFYRVILNNLKKQGLVAINATEGGAYMEGAEHLTLQEAKERYIEQLEKVDFYARIDAECQNALKCDKHEVLYELSTAFVDVKKTYQMLLEQAAKVDSVLNDKASVGENASDRKADNTIFLSEVTWQPKDTKSEEEFLVKAIELMKESLSILKDGYIYKQYLRFYAQSYFEAYDFNKSIKESNYNKCKAYCELFDEILFITEKVQGMLEDNINSLAEKIKGE